MAKSPFAEKGSIKDVATGAKKPPVKNAKNGKLVDKTEAKGKPASGMQWHPSKKPPETATDRGTFAFKANGKGR